ncbi:hypothetical protein AB0J80_37820 [Actinoplanes sp. NPDC049548]|uniref:hypothetical protein n=1 Tax=Actinoplanes sp. NPDC049548 TaxID=3155152 RepID=UPI0034270E4C
MQVSRVLRSRRRVGARLTTAFVALVAAVSATLVVPTTAHAATDTTSPCSPLHIGGVDWGGILYCNYGEYGGYDYATLSDGTLEVFVVGGDHSVWTKWRSPSGSYSGWVKLGGVVHSNGEWWYLQTIALPSHGGGTDWEVRVIGTDNRAWCRIRSSLTGTWSPDWSPSLCLTP